MTGYIEKKNIKGNTYYYLTETKRENGKWKKTRKYLGVHSKSGFEKPRKENPKPQLSKKEIQIIELIRRNYTQRHSIGPNTWEEDKERMVSFIYNTNAIEGNTLTLKETASVLEGKKIASKPKDVREVHNMKECVDFIFKSKKEITEEFILGMHKMEMNGIMTDAGNYRQVDVKVGNYICPPHEEIPKLMKAFIEWYQSIRDAMHAFELAALVHTRFVRIHPFQDGNGRMARLLMNYVLVKNKYPLVNIFNDEKLLYYLVLREIDAKKRFKPFTKYLYKVFIQQYKEYAII